MFKITSKELNVNGNECDILKKCFEFSNEHKEQNAEEFDSKNDDYRDINEKEKTVFIHKKLNMSPIHKELSKLDSNKTQMNFNATSFYPSAMCNEISVYPKRESGFVFAPHLNDVNVKAFNDQTFNKDGDESAILTIKSYSLPYLIFQHLPDKEKVKFVEVNRMGNG